MRISASKGFLLANHPVKASPRLRNGSPLEGPAEHEVLLDALEMAGASLLYQLSPPPIVSLSLTPDSMIFFTHRCSLRVRRWQLRPAPARS